MADSILHDDVNPLLGSLHREVVGCVVDASQVHAASILRVEASR